MTFLVDKLSTAQLLHMFYSLPYMWLDKCGCVELLALVSSIHVPRYSILFEAIPEGRRVASSLWTPTPTCHILTIKNLL